MADWTATSSDAWARAGKGRAATTSSVLRCSMCARCTTRVLSRMRLTRRSRRCPPDGRQRGKCLVLEAVSEILSAEYSHDLDSLPIYAVIDAIHAANRAAIACADMINCRKRQRRVADFAEASYQRIKILACLQLAKHVHAMPINARQIRLRFIAEPIAHYAPGRSLCREECPECFVRKGRFPRP